MKQHKTTPQPAIASEIFILFSSLHEGPGEGRGRTKKKKKSRRTGPTIRASLLKHSRCNKKKNSHMTDSLELTYEKDLASQTNSGPHHIDDERRDKNRQVFAMIRGLLPFLDIHKKSDCDLIFRFLIAKKWDTQETAKALAEYVEFREKHALNDILWEEFPAETMKMGSHFSGFDFEGHPIFIKKPDPTVMGQLLVKFPRELLMRVHFKMMEQSRRLCLLYNTDRVSCLLDMSLLSMSVLTNPSAMGFLKEMTHLDQMYYPENMRYMLILNGGWTFSSLYSLVKPWLDPRVQQKINFIGSGAKMNADLAKFVELRFLVPEYGGTNESGNLLTDQDVQSTPRGTAPAVLRSNPYAGSGTPGLDGSPRAGAPSAFPVPEPATDDPEALL
jgi:hypothetical protein